MIIHAKKKLSENKSHNDMTTRSKPKRSKPNKFILK